MFGAVHVARIDRYSVRWLRRADQGRRRKDLRGPVVGSRRWSSSASASVASRLIVLVSPSRKLQLQYRRRLAPPVNAFSLTPTNMTRPEVPRDRPAR